jgi:hypothetical protein
MSKSKINLSTWKAGADAVGMHLDLRYQDIRTISIRRFNVSGNGCHRGRRRNSGGSGHFDRRRQSLSGFQSMNMAAAKSIRLTLAGKPRTRRLAAKTK